MSRALITGSDGFVGRHLAAHLTAEGIDALGAVIGAPETGPCAVNYQIDLLDAARTARVVAEAKPDVIYHLAGQASVALSWKEPVLTTQVNVCGTLNLLEAVREHCPDARVLIIGSSDQYGVLRPDDCPVNELQPVRPQSPYAVSKAAQEQMAALYASSYGLDIVMVRAFNHVGPGQRPGFAVPDFAACIAQIERGAEPVLRVGNLEARRDFSDVRDIVRGYRLLAEKGVSGEVYNIGSGRAYRVRELLDMLLALSNAEITIETDPARLRPSDIPLVQCCNDKLRRDTGYEPEWHMVDTLRDVLDDFRRRP